MMEQDDLGPGFREDAYVFDPKDFPADCEFSMQIQDLLDEAVARGDMTSREANILFDYMMRDQFYGGLYVAENHPYGLSRSASLLAAVFVLASGTAVSSPWLYAAPSSPSPLGPQHRQICHDFLPPRKDREGACLEEEFTP